MRISRGLLLLVSTMVVGLLAPLGAEARPVPGPRLSTPVPRLVTARPLAPPSSGRAPDVVVSRVASAPANARLGHTYVLAGLVRNDGLARARSRVVVHLLGEGLHPVVIGSTIVGLAAHRSGAFEVGIRLPRVLRNGSYALVACVRSAGGSSPLGCATAERHV